jgi:hypothetical protein
VTYPEGASSNFADDNAHGFVQAQDIYGDVTNIDNSETVVLVDMRFELPPGPTAADKYRVGVYYLCSGMASEARRLIGEAMAEGHRTSEARFRWLIAMLSERTIGQFSDEEISQLTGAAQQQPSSTSDSWEDGAHLIFQLLESVGVLPANPKPNIDLVIKKFETLSKAQRDLLLPHLELFLEGPLKDSIWREERSNAETGQSSMGRKKRAWMFFEPVPAKPRARDVQTIATTSWELMAAWAGTGFFVAAVGFFGWELLRHGAVLGLLAYVIALMGGAVAAVTGFRLRCLAGHRRQREERLIAPRPTASAPPNNGFAARVDALFNWYVGTSIRDKDERAAWKAAVAGIRKFDRDEIVTEYREARIPADRVAWLIRFRVHQSRDRWRSGEMYQFRTELRPKPGAVAACWAGIAIAFLGGICTIALLRAYALADAATVIVAFSSGMWAWRTWLGIDLERRRFADDTAESERRHADAYKEFLWWSAKLEPRPTDTEMAAWLESDRTVLLAKAIDHYKLDRHQVVTHAFLEESGPRAKSARVRNGPMRYSRYTLIVFLLTSDGVRQMTADLKFEEGDIRKGDRLNYRYDTVASARVSLTSSASDKSRIQQKFKLTLVNGEEISTVVTDLDPEDFQQGETEQSLERATLDAASVANTLHVLEGIAAEGKAWLQQCRTGHARNADRR